jgi:hypothetical protein
LKLTEYKDRQPTLSADAFFYEKLVHFLGITFTSGAALSPPKTLITSEMDRHLFFQTVPHCGPGFSYNDL